MPRLQIPFQLKDHYEAKGVFFHTLFEAIDGYLVTMVGAGSATIDDYYLHLATGALLNNLTDVCKNPYEEAVTGDVMLINQTSWDKRRRFKTKVAFGSVSAQTGVICMGEGVTFDTYVGYRFTNNTLYGCSRKEPGVGTEKLTDALKTFTAGELILLEARHVPAVGSQFFINGVYAGSLAIGIPSGKVGANIPLWVRIQTTEAVAKDLYVGEWMFLQEL